MTQTQTWQTMPQITAQATARRSPAKAQNSLKTTKGNATLDTYRHTVFCRCNSTVLDMPRNMFKRSSNTRSVSCPCIVTPPWKDLTRIPHVSINLFLMSLSTFLPWRTSTVLLSPAYKTAHTCTGARELAMTQ